MCGRKGQCKDWLFFLWCQISKEYRNIFTKHLSDVHPEESLVNVVDCFDFDDDVNPSACSPVQFDCDDNEDCTSNFNSDNKSTKQIKYKTWLEIEKRI
jgi:hypothetical protein